MVLGAGAGSPRTASPIPAPPRIPTAVTATALATLVLIMIDTLLRLGNSTDVPAPRPPLRGRCERFGAPVVAPSAGRFGRSWHKQRQLAHAATRRRAGPFPPSLRHRWWRRSRGPGRPVLNPPPQFPPAPRISAIDAPVRRAFVAYKFALSNRSQRKG